MAYWNTLELATIYIEVVDIWILENVKVKKWVIFGFICGASIL